MPNIPPIPDEDIQKIVKMVFKAEDVKFPKISDEEVLNIVHQFLSLRRYVENAQFPLLCSTCKKPMNFVGFTYKGENFLFWHCYDCHMNPDFERNEPHISFNEFKQVLQELISKRRKKREQLF